MILQYAATLDESQRKRIEGSISQISEKMDDFHIATHDRDAAKSRKEVKKTKGMLKLLKSQLKFE